jgi:hypothetical protein
LQNHEDENGDPFTFQELYLPIGDCERDVKEDADLVVFGCNAASDLSLYMTRFMELALQCIQHSGSKLVAILQDCAAHEDGESSALSVCSIDAIQPGTSSCEQCKEFRRMPELPICRFCWLFEEQRKLIRMVYDNTCATNETLAGFVPVPVLIDMHRLANPIPRLFHCASVAGQRASEPERVLPRQGRHKVLPALSMCRHQVSCHCPYQNQGDQTVGAKSCSGLGCGFASLSSWTRYS